MKQYLPLAFAGLVMAGCTKTAPAPAPAPTPYAVGWTCDGNALTSFNWSFGSAGVDNGQLRVPTIHVKGRIQEGNGASTEVEVGVPPAVGTYAFGPTSAAWGIYRVNSTGYYAGTALGITGAPGSGSITVTEVTGTLRGTFTFTGINPTTGATKTVTNGTFYVPR